jgi:hypothetical protein
MDLGSRGTQKKYRTSTWRLVGSLELQLGGLRPKKYQVLRAVRCAGP